MIDVMKTLDNYKPIKKDNYVEVKCPVFIKMINDYLVLKIYQTEDGDYTIKDNGNLFVGYQHNAKYYFDLFNDYKKYNYLVDVEGDTFYSDYRYDYNVRVAISNFIRFYVYLDDFINSNNLK